MKTPGIIIFCTIFFVCCAYPQKASLKQDTMVYRELLFQIEKNAKSIPVESIENLPIYYRTISKILAREHFQGTDIKRWTIYDKTDKDWKQFADNPDLTKLQDQKLNTKIDSHNITEQQYKDDGHKSISFLTLSPIIYSSDKTMALCAIEYWHDSADATTTVYVLEYSDGKWVLKRSLLTSYN